MQNDKEKIKILVKLEYKSLKNYNLLATSFSV